jgi:hypothetical protein
MLCLCITEYKKRKSIWQPKVEGINNKLKLMKNQSHEIAGQIFDNEYDAREGGNGWNESS